MFKYFNDIDFTALKILKCLNIPFYWISGDSCVNQELAKTRSIPFIHTRESDGSARKKSYYINNICEAQNYNLANVWFVGDDFFDMSAIEICGKTFCPSNSCKFIQNKVTTVIPRKSGEYLAAWLIDHLIDTCKLDYPSEDDIAKQELSESQKY